MTLSVDERIKKLDDEMNQLKTKKQAILNRERRKQKNERIKKLIALGELLEKHFDCDNKSLEQLDEEIKRLKLGLLGLNHYATPQPKEDDF